MIDSTLNERIKRVSQEEWRRLPLLERFKDGEARLLEGRSFLMFMSEENLKRFVGQEQYNKEEFSAEQNCQRL